MTTTSTASVYSLRFNDVRTYSVAALFVAGNILLPQLFHLLPQGGTAWLPIYFFTLVGAYKYGWRAGMLTAIASPLANSALFGMPAPEILPVILLKSSLLAIAAGYAAHRFRKATLAAFIAVVAFYQVAGGLGQWLMTGSFQTAFSSFCIGLPGMLLQVFGAYFLVKYVFKK